jgi:hypothetical protein
MVGLNGEKPYMRVGDKLLDGDGDAIQFVVKKSLASGPF